MVSKMYISIKKFVSSRMTEVVLCTWDGLAEKNWCVKVLERPLMPTQEDHYVLILEGHESYKKDIPEYT